MMIDTISKDDWIYVQIDANKYFCAYKKVGPKLVLSWP